MNEKYNTTNNKNWVNVLSNIVKSILVLLIIGFIMLMIAAFGSMAYRFDSIIYNEDGWNNFAYLNPGYGLIGIIIYILANFLGFLSYKNITNNIKNCKTNISKILFIIFSFLINVLMLVLYIQLFDTYSFENVLFEFFNSIIINGGFITFPLIFIIIDIISFTLNKTKENLPIDNNVQKDDNINPKGKTKLYIFLIVFSILICMFCIAV